jgi:hypothetical protein
LGNRKSVTTQQHGERARILQFDPARRNLRTPIAHIPKHEKPLPPPSMLRIAIRRAIAFVMRISRALRSQSRGAESSGKRRA